MVISVLIIFKSLMKACLHREGECGESNGACQCALESRQRRHMGGEPYILAVKAY